LTNRYLIPKNQVLTLFKENEIANNQNLLKNLVDSIDDLREKVKTINRKFQWSRTLVIINIILEYFD